MSKSISRIASSQGKVQPTSVQVQIITVEMLTHTTYSEHARMRTISWSQWLQKELP